MSLGFEKGRDRRTFSGVMLIQNCIKGTLFEFCYETWAHYVQYRLLLLLLLVLLALALLLRAGIGQSV